MKKIFIATAGVALLTITANARELSANEALAAAMQKMNVSRSFMSMTKSANTPSSSMRLSFTQKSANDKSLFYVYDQPGGGYVIASADDRANALLGYADEGSYVEMLEVPAFREWTEQCKEAMEWLSRQPEVTSTTPQLSSAKEQTEDALRRNSGQASKLTPVLPLLGNIKWGQDYPFNAMCPYKTGSDGTLVQAPTGCVATATAQIMMYYKWPETGVGTHDNRYEETQSVDFSQSTYDWAHIMESYTGKETKEEIMPVAKLLSDIGCAMDMIYGASGSGIPSDQAVYALATYFRYDRGIHQIERTCYTSEQWNDILRKELNEKRPVLLSAVSGKGGHTFVVDGYDENGLYHVNWGWYGKSNGHFNMDYLDYKAQGTGSNTSSFNIEQSAIINIKKDEIGSSAAPERLCITEQLEYNSSNNSLTYCFKNDGLDDFTGLVGFKITDATGNVRKILKSCSSYPVSFNRTMGVRIFVGTDFECSAGLTVRPFYMKDGEEVPFDCPLSTCNYLVSYNISENEIGWKDYVEDEPMLKVEEYKVLRNYVGIAPKIELTITNMKESNVEYNDKVNLFILAGDDVQCYGTTQLILLPGETKTITVDCVMERNVAPEELQVGEYSIALEYMCGFGAKDFYDSTGKDSFEGKIIIKTETEAVNIVSYKNFTLDKTEIEPEQELTLTFDVVNDGGFAKKQYVAYIYDVNDVKVGSIDNADAGIEPHATTTVSVSGVISHLEPGIYTLRVRDYPSDGYIMNDYPQFTIKEISSTAIVNVSGKTDCMSGVKYDMSGRRVTNTYGHGLYIIEGKKVIK